MTDLAGLFAALDESVVVGVPPLDTIHGKGRAARTRHRLVAAAAALVLTAGISEGAVLLRPAHRQTLVANGIDSSTRARLLASADEEAQGLNGRAEHVDVVESSYVTTESTLFDLGVPAVDDAPVWVVELTGHFTCGECSGLARPGHPQPNGSGTTAVIVLNRTDLHGRSFGFGTTKDLSQLGKVTRLR